MAVKLVDYYYKKYEHTPVDAINHAMVRIRGSYALALMFEDYPEEIYVARKDSPMIIGVAGRRVLCGIRCAGNPEIHPKCILYRKHWRLHSRQKERAHLLQSGWR